MGSTGEAIESAARVGAHGRPCGGLRRDGTTGSTTGSATGTTAPAGRSGQPRRSMPRPGPKELGRIGENVAFSHLTDRGIVVLSRNWRSRDGELDLVGTDRERLIVCEVKTRSGDGYGAPQDAITPTKIERIRKLTLQWMATYHLYWCEVRFDVVAVRWVRPGVLTVQHLEGAF